MLHKVIALLVLPHQEWHRQEMRWNHLTSHHATSTATTIQIHNNGTSEYQRSDGQWLFRRLGSWGLTWTTRGTRSLRATGSYQRLLKQLARKMELTRKTERRLYRLRRLTLRNMRKLEGALRPLSYGIKDLTRMKTDVIIHDLLRAGNERYNTVLKLEWHKDNRRVETRRALPVMVSGTILWASDRVRVIKYYNYNYISLFYNFTL